MLRIFTQILLFILCSLAALIYFRVELLNYIAPKVISSFNTPIQTITFKTFNSEAISVSHLQLKVDINSTTEVLEFEDLLINHNWREIKKISSQSISLANYPETKIAAAIELSHPQFFQFTGSITDAGQLSLKAVGSYEPLSQKIDIFSVESNGKIQRLSHWLKHFEVESSAFKITDGEFQLSARASFIQDKLQLIIATLQLEDLDLSASDIELEGANAEIKIDSTTATPPASIIAIKKITSPPLTTGQLNANLQIFSTLPDILSQVRINSVTSQIWGGSVESSDIVLNPEQDSFELDIIVKRVDLAQLLRDYPQQAVTATGSLSGTLPLRFAAGSFTMNNALLKSDTPGLLKLNSTEGSPLFEQNNELADVGEILKNYNYSSLSARGDLNEKGNLTLLLNLAGRNPDYKSAREVALNLSIEENLPALFQSLGLKKAVQSSSLKQLNK